ncbi:DoxX family protein [Polaribacter ponticola]|uniref:DoxX family protein n=1 Tax=Polaribacter ponticola TaxID=2978475 RepID=A0ABT5S993_9FLAO|nr:DoxX family protein [Polaribacter sp. MSW5]MDD7914041.1 DoxX family protein [Polaribacter sp. MSW5]
MFVLKIVLAVAFVVAGGFKIFRAKPMVDQFKEFGLPNFGVQLVGTLEVLGAIGLFVPSLSLYATIGLIILMIGAVFNHLKTKHPFKTLAPALILGILSSILLFLMIN